MGALIGIYIQLLWSILYKTITWPIRTKIDPNSQSDRLVGQVICAVGFLPDIYPSIIAILWCTTIIQLSDPCISAGVGTKIDPTLCRADRLVGQVLGAVGALPDIYTELEISYFLLRRLLGVRTEGDKKGAKVSLSFMWIRFSIVFKSPYEILFAPWCISFKLSH